MNPTSNNTAIGINLGSPNGIPIIHIAIIDARVMSTKLSGFNFSLTIQEFNLESQFLINPLTIFWISEDYKLFYLYFVFLFVTPEPWVREQIYPILGYRSHILG